MARPKKIITKLKENGQINDNGIGLNITLGENKVSIYPTFFSIEKKIGNIEARILFNTNMVPWAVTFFEFGTVFGTEDKNEIIAVLRFKQE